MNTSNIRMHLTGYSALRPLPPAGDAGGVMHKGSLMKDIFIIVFCCLLLGACTSNVEKDGDLGYQGRSTDGETVEETLSRLKKDPSIKVRVDRGWTVATLESGRIIWSFTPEDHPAHPSFVKREVIEKDGSIYIDTTARCGAEKYVCDKLVQDFIQLNDKIRENFSK